MAQYFSFFAENNYVMTLANLKGPHTQARALVMGVS